MQSRGREQLRRSLKGSRDALRRSADEHKERWALHYAVKSGNTNRVRTLLQNETFDVNERDGYGNTPVYYACLCGHSQVLFLLLHYGATLDLRTIEGERCYLGSLTLAIRQMIKEHNLKTYGKDAKMGGRTIRNSPKVIKKNILPLGRASLAGQLITLQMHNEILPLAVNRDYHITAGFSMLDLALFGRHYDAARYLQKAGAQPTIHTHLLLLFFRFNPLSVLASSYPDCSSSSSSGSSSADASCSSSELTIEEMETFCYATGGRNKLTEEQRQNIPTEQPDIVFHCNHSADDTNDLENKERKEGDAEPTKAKEIEQEKKSDNVLYAHSYILKARLPKALLIDLMGKETYLRLISHSNTEQELEKQKEKDEEGSNHEREKEVIHTNYPFLLLRALLEYTYCGNFFFPRVDLLERLQELSKQYRQRKALRVLFEGCDQLLNSHIFPNINYDNLLQHMKQQLSHRKANKDRKWEQERQSLIDSFTQQMNAEIEAKVAEVVCKRKQTQRKRRQELRAVLMREYQETLNRKLQAFSLEIHEQRKQMEAEQATSLKTYHHSQLVNLLSEEIALEQLPLSNLNEDFRELINDSQCTDITFLVSGSAREEPEAEETKEENVEENQPIAAHLSLLLRSEYFSTFLFGSFRPVSLRGVPVREDVSAKTFVHLLEYIYSGDVLRFAKHKIKQEQDERKEVEDDGATIGKEKKSKDPLRMWLDVPMDIKESLVLAFDLIQLANEYFLPPLIDICEIWILKNHLKGADPLFTAEDACELYQFADTYQAFRLRQAIMAFMIANFGFVERTDQWPLLSEPLREHITSEAFKRSPSKIALEQAAIRRLVLAQQEKEEEERRHQQ